MEYILVDLENYERFMQINNLSWEGLIVEEYSKGKARIYLHLPKRKRRYIKQEIGRAVLKIGGLINASKYK